MIAFVTGASGMVGANLCRKLLDRGAGVRALTRRPLEHPLLTGLGVVEVRGDLSDPSILQKAMTGCTHVFHVAGLVSYRKRDRDLLYQVNVRGTENILRSAHACGVQRVILTSSTAAIGIPGRSEVEMNEDSPFPAWCRSIPYLDSKRAGEELVKHFPDLHTVVVNPATIYGAGDVYMNTGIVFQKIRAGKLSVAPPGGTSVVSVRDCVTGHLLAAEKGRPGRRYILASQHCSFTELFAEIARALEVRPPRFRLSKLLYAPALSCARLWDLLPRGKEAVSARELVILGFSRRYFSSQRARVELGWTPTQTPGEMIAEAAEFYRSIGKL